MGNFKELSSSVSATIKSGASVVITTLETVRVLDTFVGVIGIRESIGDKLQLGATLVEGGYCGTLQLHLYNRSANDFEIRTGDKVANIVCLVSDRLGMVVRNEQ